MKTINAAVMDELKFDEKGLIPAVIQDVKSGTVLMVAYMNREALERTLREGRTWFFSRSRQSLWAKGETSGHVQKATAVYYDCDADTLLVQVHQEGMACHTGTFSCFNRSLAESGEEVAPAWAVLSWLEELIRERREKRPAGSYTTWLFEQGTDQILKKIGEEATEVVIAAKGGQKSAVVYETADLLYHLLVMLREKDIELKTVWEELAKRHGKKKAEYGD
ncbi:MAG: bifunctional phosphoribosyl-AMP cyclohydrolase/phosphoribosyl-ATP diphosphatase HisIE [Peptococcaceae bacterium]|nr:bifunctional phosphoribosyl-AMP cyclohydrolase/phosphoribosyl-ATP diphosphatase HisIE [Peptococcaceae bacterium]MDH7525650.1 bifunctional phosphoribosyl-AMP cyclohydrolase/phosphoribosyl-ATP diphosphatase HisIE [Peptococcaceae bacterium]